MHSSSATDAADGKGQISGSAGIKKWIGVDVDSTLCEYTTWKEQGTTIGRPVPAMVARIRRWLAAGVYDVKLFTARACEANWNREEDFRVITDLCTKLFGRPLEITCTKDFACCQIWDDRAVTVQANTGYRTARSDDMALESGDPLLPIEEIDLLPPETQETALAGGYPPGMRM